MTCDVVAAVAVAECRSRLGHSRHRVPAYRETRWRRRSSCRSRFARHGRSCFSTVLTRIACWWLVSRSCSSARCRRADSRRACAGPCDSYSAPATLRPVLRILDRRIPRPAPPQRRSRAASRRPRSPGTAHARAMCASHRMSRQRACSSAPVELAARSPLRHRVRSGAAPVLLQAAPAPIHRVAGVQPRARRAVRVATSSLS